MVFKKKKKVKMRGTGILYRAGRRVAALGEGGRELVLRRRLGEGAPD